MRILIANRNFDRKGVVCGGEMSVRALGRSLRDMGHEIGILSVDDHTATRLHEPTGFMDFRVKTRNLYLDGDHPAAQRLLFHINDRFRHLMDDDYVRVLETFRPDVVNTNTLASLSLGVWRAAFRLGIPVVHTANDYYPVCTRSGMIRKDGTNCANVCRLCRIFARNRSLPLSRKVSHAIYVSEYMKSVIHDREGLFPDCAQSVVSRSYAPPDGLPARKGLLEPDRLNIGFIARLSPEKGLESLLGTLREFFPRSWRLHVAGNGNPDYVAHLKALARDLPVEFLGQQKPEDLYARVDVTVANALWNEPSGRTVMESILNGAVPIVTNRGGLFETAGNGAWGFCFEPERPRDLIQILNHIRQTPSVLDEKRLETPKARQLFDPTRIAERTLSAFEDAIQNNRSRV